ncbi:hypothetical protein NF27_EY00840 [Candidatus Jidaibacter acanthamoeba]|uniref:Uncharacterized protein n=1 Tax=Candidatus Jidaibacter acanthamoebae TaxID=86105 RepID=A0A0C1QLP1_9RICK|nr:hypothetical protein [Candidatus Jidaibacter acanthamoeba]KIE04988.1 hypothetical protein NF27_EY00840 [Candidatus Jidaibacter acanthamoeba]
MAVNQNNNENKNRQSQNDNSNLSSEEQKKMHDNYSAMGKKGGKIGGEARKEQMAHEDFNAGKKINKDEG